MIIVSILSFFVNVMSDSSVLGIIVVSLYPERTVLDNCLGYDPFGAPFKSAVNGILLNPSRTDQSLVWIPLSWTSSEKLL